MRGVEGKIPGAEQREASKVACAGGSYRPRVVGRSMPDWFVFQGLNFDVEMRGGFLWAPTTNAAGAREPDWVTVGKVRAGDLLYSSRNRVVTHVLVASEDGRPANRPPAPYPKPDGQSDVGNRVSVEFVSLNRPWLSLRKIAAEALPFFTGAGGPLDRRGNGNVGYLYELAEPARRYMAGAALRGQVGHVEALSERYRR